MVGTDVFGTKAKKSKKPLQQWENPVEAWRDLPNALGNTVKQESKNLMSDALAQVANLERDVQKLSGELQVGESIDLTHVEKAQANKPSYPEFKEMIQPGYEYHRPFARVTETKAVVKEDTKQIQIRIDQIVMELKMLTNSSQELEIQFKEVSMAETPVEPGAYHLNFFEWVFSIVQKARERIEESQAWLSMFKSKKKQKGYWNMFKKHGTTFGLSGERVVATQTG